MKTFRIENDYTGYLEGSYGIDFISYTEAMNELHELIKGECNWMINEYPKSKFNIGYIDEKQDKWINLYSISSAKVRKMMKLNIF